MYKNEKFSFKLMISVNGFTEKPTSKDYNKISFEEKEITISELEQFIKQMQLQILIIMRKKL